MRLLVLALVAAVALPAAAQETRRTVCSDGYVYEEACREIDGETFCTLRPVEDLKRGLAVRGCSDMTVLGTVAMLTAVHGSDLWTTSHGLRGGESAGGELVEANPLGQSVEKRIALKLAAIGAGTLAIHTLAKKDPKAARKLRAATVAALAVVAGRNMWLALKDAEKGGAVPVAVSVSW